MKYIHHFFLTLGVCALLWTGHVHASDADIYQQARQAYQTRKLAALQEAADTLKQQHSPLLPYLQYWQFILTLDQLTYPQVQAYLQENGDTLPAQRVRELWLKRLGRMQAWDQFVQVRAQIPVYYALNDVANQCYQVQAAIALDDPDAYDSGKALLLTGRDLPADCQGMLDALQEVGVLDEDLLNRLYRDALFENKISLAKTLVKRSTRFDTALLKQIDEVSQNPAQALKKNTIQNRSSYGKALYLYAIQRQARADIALAQASFQKYNSLLNNEEKKLALAQIALEAARKHNPDALRWFAKVDPSTLTALQWEWYARSALRAADWVQLLKIIDAMPSALSEEAAWRYWKARALKEKGQVPEAVELLAKLSQERHYYGWLAADDLGPVVGEPATIYVPTEDEIRQFSKLQTIRRIEALYEAEARYEAKMEWMFLLEGLDDPTRIAAAQYALRKGWFDLTVLAADKTTRIHNFELRYPTPYRDYLQKAAKMREIDEAWVYGIIRQESRFMHYAKSTVGAGGLMQVMPATAKWIAKKLGWARYHDGMLHDIDTNVNLGTYYMRYTLDAFAGQEVMATAAYNAGPGRARKWAADRPLEGAIYVETIPFAETRNYVKKVLANAHMYASRLGLPVQGLKARLGTIQARDMAEGDAMPATVTMPDEE